MNKFVFSTAIGSMLLLGACASTSTATPTAMHAKIEPEYVSAKKFIYAECNEMSEEMAKAQYELRIANTKEKIAIAKGQYDAIVRAGYSKHCGDARYADRGPRQPQPQIIVVQPQQDQPQQYPYPPQYQQQQYQPQQYPYPPQYQQPAQFRYEYMKRSPSSNSDDWDDNY